MKVYKFLILFVPFLTFSQDGFRKLTRLGEKAFSSNDYITATDNSIKALSQKGNFKKAVVLFEKSIVRLDKYYQIQIKKLDAESASFKDLDDVRETEEILSILKKLSSIQDELMFFPDGVKLSDKKIVDKYTKDYSSQIYIYEERLVDYKDEAMALLIDRAMEIFDSANNLKDIVDKKLQFRKAYKVFESALTYNDGDQEIEDDINGMMSKLLNSSRIKIAVLNPVNASGYTTSYYDKINALVNQVRADLSKNKFVTLVNLSRYESNYYSNNFSNTGAEIVIKFTFNSWGQKTTRKYIDSYSNSAERKKKDGTVIKYYVSGDKYKYDYVCNFNVIAESIKTNDNVVVLSESFVYNIQNNQSVLLDACYLIGSGDSYANSSGCSLKKNMPNPSFNTENLFRDNFISLASATMRNWFD